MANPSLAQGNAATAPKLLDRVRETIRTSRYSPRTEAAYVDWIKRYIRFHGIRHPQDMGVEEVKSFLSHLATQMNVAASTQNQAFSALLFLYQDVPASSSASAICRASLRSSVLKLRFHRSGGRFAGRTVKHADQNGEFGCFHR